MGVFNEWLDLHETVDIVDLSGKVRPLVLSTLEKEIKANINDIAAELAQGFYNASRGKARDSKKIESRWEFQISPTPVSSGGRKFRLGNILIAYQLPPSKQEGKRGLSQEEKDKYVKERTPIFKDFLRNTLLQEDTLDELATTITRRVYEAGSDGYELDTDQAKVVWDRGVTGKEKKRPLGRVLVAHWVPEKKKVVKEPATDF